MPDIIGLILWPIRWVIELILVAFHSLLTSLGMQPDAGLTWILSIVGLVIVVRAALIPLFVRQIKNQRRMLEVAPQVKKIQDKYKGKKDQASREAQTRETMALYKETGTNPLSSCMPLLIQMPIFFGLFSTLNNAQHNKTGVGMLNSDLAKSFANSEIAGAPLKATFFNNNGNVEVMIIAAVMIIVMCVSQFITQRQIVSKNMSDDAKASPMYRQQQMMLYFIPIIFAISGVSFPLGVMSYWLVSNFWTMAQQYLVIRNMPNPGSEAERRRNERLRARGKLVEPEKQGTPLAEAGPIVRENSQRQQPVGKKRAKKQGGQGSTAAQLGGQKPAKNDATEASDE